MEIFKGPAENLENYAFHLKIRVCDIEFLPK